MDLSGRVALVTGGGHRIGRAIALALAGRGAHVAVHYGSSADAAARTAAEIRALGVESLPVYADLSRTEAVAPLFGAVERWKGGLDILVNNAATFRHRRLEAIDADAWDEVLAVNLRAPFFCLQAAARLMVAGGRAREMPGLVVNLADLSGVLAWRGYAHHSVSKAGLLHLTRVAARELAPTVRVNAVVPGPVLPPPGMDPGSETWRRIGSANPMGRPGNPDDVTRAVLFLAASDFITGIAIPVDGGEHLLGPVNH